MKKSQSKISQIYAVFLKALPVVMYFSFFPVMRLGANESMNFELSLPLIWLVSFDLFGLGVVIKRKLWQGMLKYWYWLILPGFLTLTLVWSLNPVRGVLTAGVLWLIYLAGFLFVIMKKNVKLPDGFVKNFWQWFFGASLAISAWCFLQCFLDLVGISQTTTRLCDGCVSQMFGFPHPNGFAIEPQFMGNLLLAPTLLAIYVATQGKKAYRGRMWAVSFALMSTLFLIFSRGAIYAFVIALACLTVFRLVKAKDWKFLTVWPMLLLAFVFTLNAQGIMAAVGPTNDTYVSGVTKVLHHLSLGKLDVRNKVGGDADKNSSENATDEKKTEFGNATEGVSESENKSEAETPNGQENGQNDNQNSEPEAVFDGYVEGSTKARVKLNDAAIQIWQSDTKIKWLGVGLGGAGQALYQNDLSPAPKEIVQNEYISLLLESGIVGVVTAILAGILVIRVLIKSPGKQLLIALVVAYGVTLSFFSGLPNALHIYLLTALLTVYYKSFLKKLVS